MQLQELRKQLSEAGFSAEIAAKLDEILAQAIAKGGLGEEDRAKMNELIEIELEAGNIEADAMESMATILDTHAFELESLAKNAEANEERIFDSADKEATELEAEIVQAQGSAQPVAPPVPTLPETPVGQ